MQPAVADYRLAANGTAAIRSKETDWLTIRDDQLTAMCMKLTTTTEASLHQHNFLKISFNFIFHCLSFLYSEFCLIILVCVSLPARQVISSNLLKCLIYVH
jgi:hypothetical protein